MTEPADDRPVAKGYAMSRYVLTFRALHGRVPTAAEEARWPVWFEKIGSQIADPGHRVGEVRRVGDPAAGPDRLAGYIVIAAENLDAAVAVAEQCPMLLQGGCVEVGALMPDGPDAATN